MPQPHIQVILGSSREGRVGERVARWFIDVARQRGDLTAELIDLQEWELPFLSTPFPPMMGGPSDELTRRWGEKIAQGDGYVFVSPEYNHGYTAVLKNAIDHLYAEWVRKPVGFVGYGGAGGGVRAVEQLRQVVVELQMAPLRQQVIIPRAYRAFDEDGRLRDQYHSEDADAVLTELVWWAQALRHARLRTATSGAAAGQAV